MVPDIAELEARGGSMDDQADVVVDAKRPEIRVARSVESMKAQAGTRWVQLEIERRRLDRLLFGTGQPSEAAREGVGYPKFQLALTTVLATQG